MTREGYPAIYYKNNLLTEEESSKSTRMWTDSAFLKMVLKLVVILDILNADMRVLYMDSDVILFQNPFPHLRAFQSFDMVAQRDDTLCAGFMYIQPTPKSKETFRSAIREMYLQSIMDQDALDWVITRHHSCSFEFLPTNKFMSGREYSRHHQFFWHHTGKLILLIIIDFIDFIDNY